jgi:hypothetical protein
MEPALGALGEVIRRPVFQSISAATHPEDRSTMVIEPVSPRLPTPETHVKILIPVPRTIPQNADPQLTRDPVRVAKAERYLNFLAHENTVNREEIEGLAKYWDVFFMGNYGTGDNPRHDAVFELIYRANRGEVRFTDAAKEEMADIMTAFSEDYGWAADELFNPSMTGEN